MGQKIHPGGFRVGYIQDELGSKQEALENYRQAEQVARRLAEDHPGVPEGLSGLALTLNNLGNVQRDLGRQKEALRSYQEAARLGRQLAKHHREPEYRHGLARALNNVGVLQRALGRPQPLHVQPVRDRRLRGGAPGARPVGG